VGNTWSNKMSNPKRIGLKDDQGVRRLLENYRNDPESIEHRAASGKRRKTRAGCFVRPNSKKAPSFIDSKPASENREGRRMTYAITWAEWVGHANAPMRPHAA
jgi:hypothetical protein